MRDLSCGLSAVRELDREPAALLVGMALILLVRAEETDEWYVFANLRDPTSDDTRRILTILSSNGSVAPYSLHQLHSAAQVRFVSSGSMEHIISGLTRFSQFDRAREAALAIVKASLN